MIMLRIVKMVFKEGKEDEFLEVFRRSAPKIRQRKGCESLQLLRDKDKPNIFFTYSQWNLEKDLEAYRNSELFASTWKKVKPLFEQRAEAWSVNLLWNE